MCSRQLRTVAIEKMIPILIGVLGCRAVKTRIVLTLIAARGARRLRRRARSSSERTVVAAFYPLAFAAEQIGGAGIDVRNLTPPGVEPHDLELSGSDVRTIADADLVLYLGEGFQPALEDAIDSTSAHAVDLLDARARGPATRTSGSIRSGTPRSRSGSARSSTAGREAERFAARLRALDREFRARASPTASGDEIVTSHAAFGYLAERYGLKQVAITGISPEAEPTPRDLEEVVRPGARGRRDDGVLRDARLAATRRDRRPRGRRDRPPCSTRSKA